MFPVIRNLYAPLPPPGEGEAFERLAGGPEFLIERIVSRGHSTPPGTWLRGERDEWVVLLEGKARLELRAGGEAADLRPGDHLLIPAGLEHRVVLTDEAGPTVWLAVHFQGSGDPALTSGLE